MKNQAWVKDLTSFFDSIGRQSDRNLVRRRTTMNGQRKPLASSRLSSAIELNSDNDKNIVRYNDDVIENSQFTQIPPSPPIIDEHCVTIEHGRKLFDHKGSLRKFKSSLKKISSFDIFSGNAEDPDIPPIEAEEEEGDGDSSHNPIHNFQSLRFSFRKKTKNQPNGAGNTNNNSSYGSTNNTTAQQKRQVLKKSGAGSGNFQTIMTDKDIEKENEGVILRIRDQEQYFDGRAKYQSMLPEISTGATSPAPEEPATHDSAPIDTSVQMRSASDINDRKAQNSVLISEILPPPSKPSNVVSVLPRMSESEQYAEGGDEDEDLELEGGLSESIMANDSGGTEDNGTGDLKSIQKLLSLNSHSPQRIRWAETEEGKKLIEIKSLSPEIIKWQESQFEVITSEASYYRSIQLLVDRIYKSPLISCIPTGSGSNTLQSAINIPFNLSTASENPPSPTTSSNPPSGPLMTPLQKHHLFSNILEIHIITGELLKALESRWRENPFLEDLSDIFIEFCKEKLKPYVTYLRNQQYQTETFNQLLTKPEFKEVVKVLERDPDLGMMSVSSFLLLPMQRPLRWKLLMDVVKKNTPPGHKSLPGIKAAIEVIEHLIKECTEGKVLMEQKEQLMKIYNRLKFPEGRARVRVGASPLLNEGRLRVAGVSGAYAKSLSVGAVSDANIESISGGKLVQLYVFEDLIIISKEKKNSLCAFGSSTEDENSTGVRTEMVVEHCPRKEVQFIEGGFILTHNNSINESTKKKGNKQNRRSTSDPDDQDKLWWFGLKMKQPSRGSVAEYRCEVNSKAEKEKWKGAFLASTNYLEDIGITEALVLLDWNPNMLDNTAGPTNEVESEMHQLELTAGQIIRIVKVLPNDRAIASSGGKVGIIPMTHIRLVGSNKYARNNVTLTREVASAAITLASTRVASNKSNSSKAPLVRQNQIIVES